MTDGAIAVDIEKIKQIWLSHKKYIFQSHNKHMYICKSIKLVMHLVLRYRMAVYPPWVKGARYTAFPK